VTEEHPFWVDRPGDDEGYIWLPAGELRAGDVLSAVERDGATVRLDEGTLMVSAAGLQPHRRRLPQLCGGVSECAGP